MAGGEDDSTETPDMVPMTEFPDARDNSPRNRNDIEVPAWKRVRGPSKCTEFYKVWKYGKIYVKIKDGETAPCCENTMLYTTRVAWILKHHSDLSHASCTTYQADFILDWTKKNHRLTVLKTFRKRFNAIRYELHKIYKKFRNTEEALVNRSSWLNPDVWVKLSTRWSSHEFKSEIDSHLVDFFKDIRWSKKKGKFVTPLSKENYKEMSLKLAELEPEKRTKEAAATIFKEVLSHRSGYGKGLGEMVIPESSRDYNEEVIPELTKAAARRKEDAERHEKDAQCYQSKLDALTGDVMVLLERQAKYDKFMKEIMSQRQSQGESPRCITSNQE